MTTRFLLPASLTVAAALTLAACGMKHAEADLEADEEYQADGIDQANEIDGLVAQPIAAPDDVRSTTRTEGVGDAERLQEGGKRVSAEKSKKDAGGSLAIADMPESEDFDYSVEEVVSAAAPSMPAGGAAQGLGSVSSGSASGRVGALGGEARRDRKAEAKPAPARVAAGPSSAPVAAAPPARPYAEPNEPSVIAPTTSGELYTDHGVNDFTMVQQDAQSTFSIDVDTASYTLARRKLLEGALPSQAGVRVEEFVNYLDYDYIAPKNDPFAVNMEAMPDPFRPGHHILRVGVQGKELSAEERPPLHLTFLVDVSGSMSSADKLPLAKESLHMLVDSMQEGDTVALGTYAGRIAKLLEPTDVTDKRAIHAAIESLSSGGGTAMSSGIDLAYEMAWASFEPGAENRVIVLSDGDANIGRTSWDDMLGQIKGYADRGVTLTTVGFGMGNYKDTLMEQLANKGDGNNFYIDDRQQAQRVFVEKMGGSMITIARDVKIQVEFNDESVLAYRLIGYENRDIADKDFRNDRVDAGEVGSGHSVTALYDVILRDGYDRSLATVRMRYEAPGADKAATEKSWTFRASRLQETSSLASRDTRMAYTAATFAEVLRGSPHAAEIDLAALARYGKSAARPGEADDTELIGLIQTADRLGADEFDAAVSVR